VWDAQTGQPLTEPLKHAAIVWSAQFSPDGKRVVTASWDSTARVWDAQTGRPLTEPLKHSGQVWSAQFSPDGKRIVTASEDFNGGAARVWDAQTGQPLTEPLKHTIWVISAQFSPDGKRLVTATGDPSRAGEARVWDAQTGQPLTEPLKHAYGVNSAQFSPDGKRVVTASYDNTARVWDAQTGQPLTEPLKHSGQVWSAQFSPDGKRVVTASRDYTARVWDAQTGQPLTEPLKHTSYVISAQFSPDGKRLVTASRDYTARVWDALTGQPLTEPLKHANMVWSAQFSPDGKRVVTASVDNTARVWDVAPPPAGYPGWLLQLATAACSEVLDAQGVLEYTNPVQAIDRLRQTLSEQPGNDDWLTLGRWLLADPSARTISPFSKITLAEWIERRFKENMTNSLAELEQWAISTGDAVLLERVSQARPPAESAEAARASARALEEQRNGASSGQARFLNALAWLSAASPREDLRDGRIAVVLAEKAVAATSRKDPAILGTLAAGLAEAGRFAEAVLVQREALGLLNDAERKEDYSSRLKLYESKSPYRDAATNHLAPAVDDRLGMERLLRTRGRLCAQFAQWTLAAGDLTKVIALNPDENWNWFELASLLLETGDTGGYRKHCHAMLSRFGTTDAPPIAARTAKVCLLLPLEGADLAAAAKLAETAVTLWKGDTWAWVADFQFAKGLAEYRQANFAQAVEWTQKALVLSGTDYNRDVQAYSVLALALHRLNRAGEAREALSKATELAGAKLPRLDSGDLGPNWHNWIIAHTLLREAKALIEGGAKVGDETK
jgi:WD40 repeat protein/tetratricopeptide (TPR) repeat protein